MLYRITETTFGPSRVAPEVITFLSDTESDPIDRPDYSLTCTPVEAAEVTLDNLVAAIESAYENGNHTGHLHMFTVLMEYMRAMWPDEQIKTMLWALVNDHGLAW